MRGGAIMISFLLVAVTASAVYGENEAVLDFKGNPVKANTRYRVVVNLGGSVGRYKIDASKGCSRGVANYRLLNPNTAFSIVFVLSSEDVVRVSTQLNIKFKIQQTRKCNESMFWRVGQDEDHLVLLGGAMSSNDSMFTIERSPMEVIGKHTSYKFAFGGVDIGFEKNKIRKMRLLRDSDDLGYFYLFPSSL